LRHDRGWALRREDSTATERPDNDWTAALFRTTVAGRTMVLTAYWGDQLTEGVPALSRHHARTLGVAAATLSLVFALPAHANVRQFTDARNDTKSSVDIWGVRVDNATADPDKVIVEVRQDDVTFEDSITIYLDTRQTDPGPEYRISGGTGSEFALFRLERWTDRGQLVPFGCGQRLRIHENTDRSRAVFPRACIGKTGKVRVAVLAERGYPVRSRDWAQARRTWLPWVLR
jgi:hypothetical protein